MTKFHLFSQDSAEYASGILHWLETTPTGGVRKSYSIILCIIIIIMIIMELVLFLFYYRVYLLFNKSIQVSWSI